MKKYRWLFWIALGVLAMTTMGYLDPGPCCVCL